MAKGAMVEVELTGKKGWMQFDWICETLFLRLEASGIGETFESLIKVDLKEAWPSEVAEPSCKWNWLGSLLIIS
jgi:hypothetical protein